MWCLWQISSATVWFLVQLWKVGQGANQVSTFQRQKMKRGFNMLLVLFVAILAAFLQKLEWIPCCCWGITNRVWSQRRRWRICSSRNEEKFWSRKVRVGGETPWDRQLGDGHHWKESLFSKRRGRGHWGRFQPDWYNWQGEAQPPAFLCPITAGIWVLGIEATGP